ncbi:hypothetical protein GALMADRAFT_56567 [Galerina marginata CBS 339.88]|uniref:RRN7-type domain-containing protein n=1 Tax=Galerina marginata (strain CBS 339.88) TaxID=685588 RepID=A0A067TUR1_GALM3|nr:hypothetical protein GALMADRAFT_56567 [Galerina marginata CBS 339.88]
MAPRRRCPTCGSKQWHKEPLSGLIACSEGHVLQNYRNETTEITEVGPHAMKKRTLKSGRKKKGRGNHADPKLYHGARARYHYFLCLQLLLRKQIVALTKLWELPAEFEVICRDLWALNLALLPDPPPAEPYHHAQEDRDKALGSGSAKEGSDDEAGSEDEPDRETNEEHNSQDSDSDSDSELEALMRENSDISSSSDDDEDGVKPGAGGTKRKAKGRLLYESPMSTIAVLVVGCWTMRIPVLYRDFTRVIESYEVPYLEAVTMLPGSMVEHLTKHNVQALSPPHAPRTLRMHSVVSRLAKKLNGKYGVYTPEANAASMLWRITKSMGGTPVLYGLTKRVASVLSVPLTLDASLAPSLEQVKAKDALRHGYDNAPTEVGLVASLIIVVKMVYGLDGTTSRCPEDGEDVACGLASGQEYLRLIEAMDGERRESKYDSRTRLQVGDMKAEEMDDYIEFCAQILSGNRSDGDGAVAQYFGNDERGRRLEEAGDGRRARLEGPQAIGGGLRAGEEYKIWNARDVDGTLPEGYGRVLGRGAAVVGVDAVYLGGVVERFERRLVRWQRRVMTSSE